MKKILLVGDMVGVGKIALSSMIPILSNMQHSVSNLPTALVSNTFDYQMVEMIDLTSYMESSVEVWRKLGFEFDVILTGFILDKRQVEIVEDILAYHQVRPVVYSDPIMGDDGELYYGLDESLIDAMLELIKLSDVVFPNVTEACLMLGEEYPEVMTEEQVVGWIEGLKGLTSGSIALTSVELNGEHFVYGYDRGEDRLFRVPFTVVPFKFAGTGDIFASLLTGKMMQGKSLEEAVIYTTQTISGILKRESIQETSVRDVQIERYLKELG
ncbi:MAG: PfkB family carbohydrate kinase [Tissierellia bacterium]|nr:PfkB family carbohydrate kinase [Tissierellia bacterium]